MRHLLLAFALLLSAGSLNAQQCSGEALSQAERLLAFHVDDDDRAAVDSAVRVLPSIRNPADPSQRFSVYEVWGLVYRAEYRTRLIYYRLEDDCLLMGQEILEQASL